MAWADPVSGVVFVHLSNGLLDHEGGTLKACVNIAATALCGPSKQTAHAHGNKNQPYCVLHLMDAPEGMI